MAVLSDGVWRLLQLLADAQWHSGEELGDELGISRAAISKRLKQLEELNLPIESVAGRGYRLLSPLDLLSSEGVSACLSEEPFLKGLQLILHRRIPSTNAELMRLQRQRSIHGLVCVAEQQNAGRGRRGRVWHSPFAQNLYLSVGWHFQGGIAALEGLSLAVGVVLCDALVELGVESAQLKWPNDVLALGKKLGGVLIELAGDMDSECVVVLGVGLNVLMSEAEAIDQPWLALQELGYRGSRNQLLAIVLKHLFRLLDSYERDGFVAYRQRWNQLDAFAGSVVTLTSPSKAYSGIMRGVDGDGAVLIEQDEGLQRYIGGELSLRVSE
ncbi:bifunctional biotin--[acetyl-CoA-carboxylase] ligase/biotin operon repressor BirA [Agaribacterium sp. ZY112]|uniref:bifunctional biotin--[acetyl-CoA-carboxylase] ligase/biotin operon repressor BirA n=1 Tax=Agaribacterium sp. ZY112 TaxID=3233574 RepID=UPI00352359CA